VNETCVWSGGGATVVERTDILGGKTLSRCDFVHHMSHARTGLGSNPGCHCESGVIWTCSGYGQWLTFVIKVVDLVILWNWGVSWPAEKLSSHTRTAWNVCFVPALLVIMLVDWYQNSMLLCWRLLVNDSCVVVGRRPEFDSRYWNMTIVFAASSSVALGPTRLQGRI